MRNPGPVKVGSRLHQAVIALSQEMAHSYEISQFAAGGQIIKFLECVGKAADSKLKMSNLIISNKDEEPYTCQCSIPKNVVNKVCGGCLCKLGEE